MNGYLDTPELRGFIGEYIVRPRLGNDSGVIGAIALAASRAIEVRTGAPVTPA
jgi:hypothetical protein